VGESDFPSLGFATVGDAFQKRPNHINREFLQLQVAMVPAEGRDYRLVGLEVFFLNVTGDNPSGSWRRRLLSWRTSFGLGLTRMGLRR
jgi:hypothetical protein